MPTDIISRSIAASALSRIGDPSPIRLSSMLGGKALASESGGLARALDQMNTNRRPLLIDRSINISSFTTINGYCVLACEGDAQITFTGGAAGFRVRNTFTTVGNWTAAPTLAQWPAGTGSLNTALVVDSAAYAALNTGDNVYLADSVNNTFVYGTTNYTNLAEIAMVVAKAGGNTIYLDRALAEWNRYSAAGTVTKLGDNPCWLDLNITGERTTVREMVRVEGFARPIIDARISGNSSRGVMLVSCMGARVRAFVDNLRDDEPTAFGYGVCTAAATTDAQIEVNAKRVRHAYSCIIMGTADGLSAPAMFSGGVVRRASVTGVAISCTAASWDTHPHSDRTRFENIKAWGTHNVAGEQPDAGLNYAMQVRGTNVTVDGLETNLQRAIIYGVTASRNSIMEINNLRHHNTIAGATTSANSLVSFAGFLFVGSGTHKVNIRNSAMHNVTYGGADWNFVSLYNCEIEMGTSTGGFPGNVGGNTNCLTEYVNCVVRNPVSMNISTALTFDGGKIIKANTGGFNLLDGANLEARGHGIEITGGGAITSSAYAASSITTGSAAFRHSGVWVDDSRAAGTVMPFVYLATGATMNIKDISARAEIYGSAVVDLASIAAQGTTTFDVTVPGVTTSLSWSLRVNASADIGALTLTPWVLGTNTVRVRVTNPTAAAIDPAAVTMTVAARRAA